TEAKRLEEASSRFWNLSLDLLGIADFEGNMKRVNPAHWRILGYSEDELTGRQWFERIHPDDQARVEAETRRLAAGEAETGDFEIRALHKNGAYRTLLCSAKSSQDERLIYTIAKDITEWKEAEEAQRLAAIVESSDDGIVSAALDGTIRSWNPGAERIYGYSATEMEGRPITTIVPLDRTHEVMRSMELI